MQLGVITSYDPTTQAGEITSTDDKVLSFTYGSGQNMFFDDDRATPKLTGKHEQPSGFVLKDPDVGDAVAFQEKDDKVSAWGYVRHFLDLAERRHKTRFITIKGS